VTQMLANLHLMAHGAPFDHERTKTLMRMFIDKTSAIVDAPGFDYQAELVRQVVTLAQYDHWEIADIKEAVQSSVGYVQGVYPGV
jgi:hypothetical protein